MPLRDSLNGYLRQSRKFFSIPEPMEGDPDVAILGIPYDITSSHTPGARFGPDAFRKATDSERSHSFPLNLYQKNHPRKESLTSLMTIEDIGDLEVGVQLPESVAVHISDAAKILSKSSSKLLFLGGDHFITYPLLKGLKRGNPGIYGLVYLDSHADFYDDMGGMTLSHASTLRRIIDEKIVNKSDIVGFDFRCITPDQREELGPDCCPSDLSAFREAIGKLSKKVSHVYISIDLDVLQPHIVPGVSHPESGGLTITEIVDIIDLCFGSGKVRYADIVEFNPMLDSSQVTEIAARDIVKAILTGFASYGK
ncbi:MAG: arginase family protein [Candidatus Thorarchaeota archaeon]|nr:arginase family protein [Candidatus Thorarchaeota archaeon]